MEKEAEDLIQERVKKLPPEVRDMLASDELHTKIQTIGTKQKLHIDQLGILEDEVVLVMMGFTAPDELEAELVGQMSLPKETAQALVGDINQEIFIPVRTAMQQNPLAVEKSVVMPSSVAKPSATPAMPSVPAATLPVVQNKPVVPVVAPKPPETPRADIMLNETTTQLKTENVQQKTDTKSATLPPAPSAYKTDPYREPAE